MFDTPVVIDEPVSAPIASHTPAARWPAGARVHAELATGIGELILNGKGLLVSHPIEQRAFNWNR